MAPINHVPRHAYNSNNIVPEKQKLRRTRRSSHLDFLPIKLLLPGQAASNAYEIIPPGRYKPYRLDRNTNQYKINRIHL